MRVPDFDQISRANLITESFFRTKRQFKTNNVHSELVFRKDLERGHVLLERMFSETGAVTFRVGTRFDTRGSGEFHDYYDADEEALARAIADEAERRITAAKKPGLIEIAAELKKRYDGAATLVRDVYGDRQIMGDTAPDEKPVKP